jgi:benzylsuccinate CoA-transferase BbsF subunit
VRPKGNASLENAPHGCYPCQGEDRWCAIGVETEAHWLGLKAAMGFPAWAEHAHYATREGRLAKASALDALVSEWTHALAPREVMERCQAQGVPAGIVASGEDLYFDPHLQARGFLLDREHPRMGTVRVPGPPVRFRHRPLEVWRLGPLLGQDNAYVLRDVLGLSEEEMHAYAQAKALA